MKKLTVQSGDGEILTLEIPEIFDWFPAEFQEAASKMNRGDCYRLAEALLELSAPKEESAAADPDPEQIAAAAQRGLTALNRIQSR